MRTRCLRVAAAVARFFLMAAAAGCGSDESMLFDPSNPFNLFDAGGIDVVNRDGAAGSDDAFAQRRDARDDATIPDAVSDVLGDRASRPDADANVSDCACTKECESKGIGTCVAGECVIRCDESHSCSTRVVCPPTVPCRVLCASAGSCAGGVDCTLATKCDISCSGTQSCMGLVQCAGTQCRIGCLEQSSCHRLVSCSADQCELSCIGDNACAGGVACLGSPKACNITCGGPTACAGAVQGSGTAEIRCSGFGSCATSVSCAGESCV